MTARITGLCWRLARVPFRAPFATARGTIAYRETLIVALRADGGPAGYGEATPWPPFGQGSARDAADRLAEWARRLIGREIDVAALLADLPPDPAGAMALRCALDLALHDLRGKLAGLPVSAPLGASATSVPVNAVIGAVPAALAAEQARTAVAAGYGCVKVKVATGSLRENEARVAAVRAAAGPATRIRLDANGGWSVSGAIAAITRLERYGLELVEEPVTSGDFAAMAQVRRAVHTPIAADESVRDLASARRALDAGGADLLVVKPMVVGGLAASREIIALASSAGAGAIVTSSIGFGLEIAGALHLAATLPAPVLACGLATASLLANDLTGGEPVVRDGAMLVPDGPGLGVALDRPAFERYATGPATSYPPVRRPDPAAPSALV